MENTGFYRVVIYGDLPDYYFRNYENAAAFLLENYFDDFDIATENEAMAINNQVADQGRIENYGFIEEVEFEDD